MKTMNWKRVIGLDNLAEDYKYDLRHRMTTKGPRRYEYADYAFASDWKPVDAPPVA